MAIIPLSVLNWYPAVRGKDSLQQIMGKFGFSKADENLLERLNYRLRDIDFISAQAGSLLRDPPEALSNKQIRLLKFVKLSRFLKEYEMAASNTVSILWATGFSLSHLDLKNIAIPEAKLEGAPLDDTDLSKAALEKVDLTRSSLNRAEVEGTETLNFGQYPVLKHREEILGAATTSDDRYLISLDSEALYKWELSTGALLKCRKFSECLLKPVQHPFRLHVSRDGKSIFMVHPNSDVEVFDFQSLKSVKVYHLRYARSVVFSAFALEQQSLMLVTHIAVPNGSLTEVIFWKLNAKSAQEPLQEPCQQTEIQNVSLSKVCLSPSDDSWMAAADPKTKCINIYRLPNLALIKKIPNIEPFKDLQFFPSADKLLLSRINEAFELEIATGEQTQIFQERNWETPELSKEADHPSLHLQNDAVGNLHFFSKSPIFAYSVGSKMIRFWNTDKREVVGSITVQDLTQHRSFLSERGDFLIRSGHTYKGAKDLAVIKTADIFSQKPAVVLPDIVGAVFSPDSLFIRVIRTDSLICEFDIRTGRNRESLEFTKLNQNGDPILNTPHNFKHFYQHLCQFSPDANFLTLAERNGRPLNEQERSPGYLTLLPMNEGVQYRHFEGAYNACGLSGDGHHVIFMKSQQIEVLEIASQQIVGVIPSQVLPQLPMQLILPSSVFPVSYCVTIHAEDAFLPQNVTSELWEFNFEEKTFRSLQQFPDMQKVIFHGDNTLFILDNKGLIKKWDCQSSKETECIKVEDVVADFDVSPTGDLLVTCSYRKEDRESQKTALILWDIHTHKKLARMEVPTQVSRIHFSPDGNYLASWDKYKNSIHVWEVNENTFRLLWRIPQALSLKDIKVHNSPKMHPANQALISQFNEQRSSLWELFSSRF